MDFWWPRHVGAGGESRSLKLKPAATYVVPPPVPDENRTHLMILYTWSLFVTPVLEDQLSEIWSFPIKTEVSQALGTHTSTL